MRFFSILNKLKRKKPITVKAVLDKAAESVLETVDETETIKEEIVDVALELEEVKHFCQGIDRDHIWAFVAGHSSQDFRGNPKYLFVYINRYRSDVKAYWLCDDEDTIEQVRELGFCAYTSNSVAAQYLINRTGVIVTEQVKYAMPDGFNSVKYINLWHGVGFKRIERKQFQGDISMDLARKYIKRGTFYRDYQLMGATCPTIENEYSLDCGIDYDKFLHVGYPRCIYQKNFIPIVSFEHNLRKIKGLSDSAKLVVYAPTFRANLGNAFARAIPDFERLYKLCKAKNLLFIFKMHPNMEKEVGFIKAKDTYGGRKHFWFWDNKDDFYEIMHEMDLAIIDYSGIISDMVAMNIPHYIKYNYDYDEYFSTVSVQGNYEEKTTGVECRTFEELLKAIEIYDERDESAEIERLNKALWSYSSGKDDFEKIIQAAFDFSPQKREFPTLYSFDVFDTLFSRKVLAPEGVFFGVKERMIENGGFPFALTVNYPAVRHSAEFNVREYYSKSKVIRDSERVEISFKEIFDRIQAVYNIDDDQKKKLMDWELELELDNVIPLEKQIDKVKELLNNGEIVILISDMYLPKEHIIKMLKKADPVLATLPLFLSNEYGVLKTSQRLYFEVYKSFEPYYDFEKWIHYGDNENADIRQARKFEISARRVTKPELNNIQSQIVEKLGTYDSYLVAAMQARMCYEQDDFHFNSRPKYDFTVSYISLAFVPYVDWVIRDAQRRGFEMLYFISRDGYHMKRIADEIIKVRRIPIKTKYIYASRRTWRIPSFVEEVDSGFWEPYGNFHEIPSKKKLFKAMDLDERVFRDLFPYIDPDAIDFDDRQEFESLVDIFKHSEDYNLFLLKKAAEERVLVEGYLRQEINAGENFAFVDYYGRGYTQDCFVNLWQHITGDKNADVHFYYSRTVLPSAGHAIRYNFTTNETRHYFLESVLANMPYKSIEKYEKVDGVIKPVIIPLSYDKELFEIMSNVLPKFAGRYAALPLKHPEDTDHLLNDFMMDYYPQNRTNEGFADFIGGMVDSVALYGQKRDFAPKLTEEMLDRLENEEIGRTMMLTTDIAMSVTRSEPALQERYKKIYQILPGDALNSGRVLSEEEQIENDDYRIQYDLLYDRATQFSKLYDRFSSELEIEDRVLFITEGSRINKATGMALLKKGLDQKCDYVTENILLGRKKKLSDEQLAKKIATARFIIISQSIGLLSKTQLRDETKEIMIRENAFYLFNQALSMNVFLKWKNRYNHLLGQSDIDALQIPSEYQMLIFKTFFSSKADVDCSLRGCCVTDLYYNQEFIAGAKEKIQGIFPEAAGKKIILYMPLVRMRNQCEEWMDILDLELLQQLIGDDYVVAVQFNKKQVPDVYWNTIEIPGFSKRITKGIGLRELMVASDIIVGDYRDTFFEAPLLKKPLYSTAYDYEDYIKKNNMKCRANEFEEFLFCPVISSSKDLAEQLTILDEYDYTQQERFVGKMLTWCDGHSIDNVINYIKNNQ